MLKFLIGVILGIYIEQTYSVPNVKNFLSFSFKELDKYRKKDDKKDNDKE